eukprot:Partr_v1_DN27532_c0_g1_i1_m30761 putative Component of the ERMES MDM complex, which serves as a molecular tether to connect the endoplasmic reticulum and mitochondria. Components of this complex are involved in the control of mitochondrial shape and protein biogenesis and may function in phospholipid exchange. mdm34 is required for the interaction of the ER-resident membrane protein mmm1 and the outer mitochondrial membrane-resident beta-barrel protein mdm10 (By similarity)
MLSAHKPLVVPLQLRICSFEIDAIFSLGMSNKSGMTLTFKNDPLQKVDVQSTFDDTQSVRDMLQSEIEKQLRGVFVEVVPKVLHQISMKYVSGHDRDVEEMLGVNRSTRTSVGSLEMPTPKRADSLSHSLSDIRDLRRSNDSIGLSLSLADLRVASSGPSSPVKGFSYLSTLPAHMYPYRSSISTRSESNISSPATRSPTLPRDAMSMSGAEMHQSFRPSVSVPISLDRRAKDDVVIRSRPTFLLSPAAMSAKRLSTSPPISPIVGLHPANLRRTYSPTKHIYSRPSE